MNCCVYLKKGEEKRILEGHPWVFANEVARIDGKDKNGSIVNVYSFNNKFIGQGYINHLSKIIVRILSRNENEIGYEFFRDKIKKAWELRKNLSGFENSCRVVFWEADGLPGLVVDKYSDYLVIQSLTLGIEQRKDLIVKALIEIFNPIGIYERSDVGIREKEGLELFKGILYGKIPEKIEIKENDIKMLVDAMGGQKTGHFLDQKENRAALKDYVKNKRVLDCFSHTGGFSLHAKSYGAKEVVACDISENAINSIKENAKLNNFEIKTVCDDVFEYLRKIKGEEKFDVIVLDPPAFTKSADNVKDAIRGYRDINIQALKAIKSGGILVTCSCSHFINADMFINMIRTASISAGVSVRLLELRSQSRDHSVNLYSEESQYLKCAILYVE